MIQYVHKRIIMKRNQVILIYGLPASGKYTMAKQVQEHCGGTLFDNHYFYDMFEGLTEVSNENHYKYFNKVDTVRKAFLDVLRDFYPRKQHVRYIFTSGILRGEKLPTVLQKFANDINADFIPIELNVRADILLARCDTEVRRNRRGKLTNKNKYKDLLKQYMSKVWHSRNPNRLVLNSSDLSPEETFKQIKKHLKKFD